MRINVVNILNIFKDKILYLNMPYDNLKQAKKIISECEALLIIAGAGMSVDSGIFTYRGNNGIWNKSIKIGNELYRYDEISSLDMWKNYPELAWGFKGHFYNMMLDSEPHEGYYNLLNFVNKKLNGNYFVCTSNIDSYFKRSGFEDKKIYEVHGTMKYFQCMDKKCSERNGIIETSKDKMPPYNIDTFIATNLPQCPYCKNILRPNVSMFGDHDFYGKPYEHARKRMNNWLEEVSKNNQKLIILEIGCGINTHSLRLKNGKMLSGEWKLPKINNLKYSIRLNPEDESNDDKNTIHVNMGAKAGLKQLLL